MLSFLKVFARQGLRSSWCPGLPEAARTRRRRAFAHRPIVHRSCRRTRRCGIPHDSAEDPATHERPAADADRRNDGRPRVSRAPCSVRRRSVHEHRPSPARVRVNRGAVRPRPCSRHGGNCGGEDQDLSHLFSFSDRFDDASVVSGACHLPHAQDTAAFVEQRDRAARERGRDGAPPPRRSRCRSRPAPRPRARGFRLVGERARSRRHRSRRTQGRRRRRCAVAALRPRSASSGRRPVRS